MIPFAFSTLQDLDIRPSKSSSKNDFDFLEGKWTIHNKKLRSRLVNSNDWVEFKATHEMRKVLRGIGNVENFYATIDEKPYEGMGVRLFDPVTRLWSIYWSDSNLGTMEKPVIGTFDKNIGNFFGRDMFKGQDIIVQFQFDASNPRKPVWSQAFSPDNGKTWEWNWYMYFSKKEDEVENLNRNQNITVLELRNYLIKEKSRDRFIDYFEENFIQSQNVLGGYILGQYMVKGADDNFFWLRGFHNMASRKKFLDDFYYGDFWKRHRSIANSMLANNDNVHLLKPLFFSNQEDESVQEFNSNWFGKCKGIAVVNFYIANQKIEKLIEFIKNKYMPLLDEAFIKDISFWISETKPNDFEALPVFQDKNLLLTISFYKDEMQYQLKTNEIENKITDTVKSEMLDIITTKTTLLLYPTKNSFSVTN